MLSLKSLSMLKLSAIALAIVLATGCATQSDSKTAKGTSSEATADAKTGGESVVVSTEDVMGKTEPAAESSSQEASMPSAPVDLEYRIGPGDVLNFRSFDDEKLSMEAVVRYDGCVSLQMIPDVSVKDLTRKEAEDLIRSAYSAIYVEPQVTLTVVGAQGKTFTVLGEVANPSVYPYMRPMTVIDAISTAGGMRVNQRSGDYYVGGQGQLVKAFVIRGRGSERQVIDFDLRGFRDSGPDASDAPVWPGDIVYVPESANLVYLIGEVGRANVYALSDGLTLMRLLAFAGSFNKSTARLKQVVLYREINESETKVSLINLRQNLKDGKDVLLEPGDVIYVPRKKLINAQEFVQRATGTVSPVLSLAGQVMGLYTQAYNAYHITDKDRYNYYGSNVSSVLLQDALQGIQILNNLQSIPLTTK